MARIEEKRKTPRVDERLPIKVMEGDYSAVVETKNISASGLYFTADKPIPLMSKVMIMLLLPANVGKNTKVACNGTVVRTLPITVENKRLFETAIFFDDITDKARNVISHYVRKVLSRAR